MYLFYYPLGIENININGFSYSGHGMGKIDYTGDKMPIYAMCSGEVKKYTYSNPAGCTACCLECTQSGLNDSFYIRYLHGNFTEVNDGDLVKRGDLLGYTSNNGATSNHLHIDFSWVSNGFSPVQGTLNSDRTAFIINGITYPINKDNIDFDTYDKWKKQNGGASNEDGYCWLVMASKTTYIATAAAADTSSTLNIIAEGSVLGLSDYDAKVESIIESKLTGNKIGATGKVFDLGISIASYLNKGQYSWKFDTGSGQCVGWSKNRLYSYLLKKYNDYVEPGRFNGGDIAKNKSYMGVKATTTPTVNSIFSVQGGTYGHTGWVEYITSDGIITSEFNSLWDEKFHLCFIPSSTFQGKYYFVNADEIYNKNK